MLKLLSNIRSCKYIANNLFATSKYSCYLNKQPLKNINITLIASQNVCCYYSTEPTNLPEKQENDEDNEKRLQILKLEVDVYCQEGRKAPSLESMKDHHWEHVLSLNSRSARRKYYAFLWKVEMQKKNLEVKKEKRKSFIILKKAEEAEENKNNDHIHYGLMHNTFLLRIYDTAINHFHNTKLVRAMQYGQKLIFDCSYDQHMIPREAVNAAKQLMLCFAENRFHDDPFDLHFCNADKSGTTMKTLYKHIPTLTEPSFPLNVHEESFMDLFPKEKLVYLTPHCRNEIQEFNHDDIYIIGAMVDKITSEPLSLAKAKQLGLRMAKLPLDRYLQWGGGSGKSLTLNQMTNILLEMKRSGDWNEALKVVPRRKLVDETEHVKRFEPNLEKYKFNLNKWASTESKEKEPTPKIEKVKKVFMK